MTLIPEFVSAKSMLDFAKKNPTAFHNQRFEYAMMIGMFKFIGGFLCFLTNMVILLRSDNIEDVVKDFAAVQIISTVDNLMAKTCNTNTIGSRVFLNYEISMKDDKKLFNEYIGDELPERLKSNQRYLQQFTWLNWNRPMKGQMYRQIFEAVEDGNYEKRLGNSQKIHYMIYMVLIRVIDILYQCIYYYFAPFIVTLCLFFANSQYADQLNDMTNAILNGGTGAEGAANEGAAV